MEKISFEWDENKNSINKSKHKISFEEAQTVFYDEQALIIDDPEHSADNTMKSEVIKMKNEYDFSNAKQNPYVKQLKKQITINIDNATIEYFKSLAQSTGIPYQTLINMFLADCAKNKKQPTIAWN